MKRLIWISLWFFCLLPVSGQVRDLESRHLDSAWTAYNSENFEVAVKHFEAAAAASNFESYRLLYQIAETFSRIGDRKKALHYLDLAIAKGFDDVDLLEHRTSFDALRGDPRWEVLKRKIAQQYGQRVRIYFWGFYYGVLFLLLVLNIILFFSAGEAMYLYFALLIITDLHFELFWMRHVTHYFTAIFPWMKGTAAKWIPMIVLAYVYILSYLMFFRSFTQLKATLPWYHRSGKILAIIGVFCCAYDYFLKPEHELIIFFLLAVFVFCFFSAAVAWHRGLRHVRLYVMASVTVTVSVVLMVLDSFGLFPVDFKIGVFNVFNFGMLLFYITLTLAVGDKMKLMRREKERAQEKALEMLEEKVQERTAEVLEQKHLVDEKQKEILDSIRYAKRLQEAILPPAEFINENIPDNFVYYQPKDVVAGDFYWAERQGSRFFIAAADSTGHGVPGAMVSVVCSNALNRAVKEFGLSETGAILDKTRELVLETFEKSLSEVKDGMDISLLCIDENERVIAWSGANNPLWYVEEGVLKELKPDKQPVGRSDHGKPFATQRLSYKPGMVFYLFTDGLADQFGGPKGKKFKYKQFGELLSSLYRFPMKEQVDRLHGIFMEWKGNLAQVDDVTVIGIKI